MGAIAAGGIEVLSEDLIRDLGIPRALVQQVAVRERLELERRDACIAAAGPAPVVRDRTVILVDDGLATGSTMQAAVLALRQQAPARIVVAVPVGARETCERLARIADEVVCVSTPEPFNAVGLWYEDFSQTTDDEVQRAAGRLPRRPTPQTGIAARATRVDVVRARARPLSGDPAQYDALLDGIGDARVVLLGEATHGTHEFYRERAFITRRLIAEKGFRRGRGRGRLAGRVPRQPLRPRSERATKTPSRRSRTSAASRPGCGATPTCSTSSAGCARTTTTQPADERAGFYGLDLYSLRASMQAVLRYLDKVDPDGAAPRAPPLRLLRSVRRGDAGVRLRRRASACTRRASARS